MIIGSLVPIVGSIAGALWLSALLATPHRPRPADELADLVFARLAGRQQWMVAAAIVATTAAALVRLLATV